MAKRLSQQRSWKQRVPFGTHFGAWSDSSKIKRLKKARTCSFLGPLFGHIFLPKLIKIRLGSNLGTGLATMLQLMPILAPQGLENSALAAAGVRLALSDHVTQKS